MNLIKESIDHIVFDLELAEFSCKTVLVVSARYKGSDTVMQNFKYRPHLLHLVLVRTL